MLLLTLLSYMFIGNYTPVDYLLLWYVSIWRLYEHTSWLVQWVLLIQCEAICIFGNESERDECVRACVRACQKVSSCLATSGVVYAYVLPW